MFNHYLVNTLRYEPSLCINCGMCTAVCPHGVFAPDGKVVRLSRPQACMECGACQLNCPTNAIVVESGVGCATAMMTAALTGKKEATCGCGTEGSASCGDSLTARDVAGAVPNLFVRRAEKGASGLNASLDVAAVECGSNSCACGAVTGDISQASPTAVRRET